MVVSNLRRGRCSEGAAAGVNLCLIPEPFVACSKAHMLSEDGRCKTFDASANGYVRGEGCGSTVLKLLEDKAVIALKGSAVNQEGRATKEYCLEVISLDLALCLYVNRP